MKDALLFVSKKGSVQKLAHFRWGLLALLLFLLFCVTGLNVLLSYVGCLESWALVSVDRRGLAYERKISQKPESSGKGVEGRRCQQACQKRAFAKRMNAEQEMSRDREVQSKKCAE